MVAEAQEVTSDCTNTLTGSACSMSVFILLTNVVIRHEEIPVKLLVNECREGRSDHRIRIDGCVTEIDDCVLMLLGVWWASFSTPLLL